MAERRHDCFLQGVVGFQLRTVVTRSIIAALFVCLLSGFLQAQCVPDYRSNKNSGLFITEMVISGTVSVSSGELTGLKGKLTGACVNESSEELEERVRALFQDQGYFGATVKNVHIKISDPLAIPKPATLEAEVVEGPRYRLAKIRFNGDHAVSAAALRNAFALKRGDLFERDKIASGLESLRRLHVRRGFLDFIAIPDTEMLSNATVILIVNVEEGPQYHMGKLRISAKKEIADQLYAGWHLEEGAVFDFSYPDKYIRANRSVVPSGFNRDEIQFIRNCPQGLVEVRLLIDQTDPTLQSRPADVACKTAPEH